jgi:hypothetical protein
MLDERNDLLAKLMATENITVQQNNVPTAYFDTKKRILVLPMWKDLSTIETEMLIGHEIGHALYTPSEEWVNAIETFDGSQSVFKHILNVVEDPRIERGVKKKYPGMRKIFYFGYEELFNRGIFETDKIDPTELTLIDKLNFNFKIPGKVSFEQDPVFLDCVKKIEETTDFQSVIDLSREIYLLCQEEEKQKKEAEKSEGGQGQGDKDSDTETEPSNESSKPEENKTSTNGEAEAEVGAADSSDSKEEGSSSSGSFEQKYSSSMQEKMEEFLKAHVNDVSYDYTYLPEPIMDRIVVSYKEILENVREYKWEGNVCVSYPNPASGLTPIEDQEEEEQIDFTPVSSSLAAFNKQYSASIAYYTKVFEMKKKATEHKKTMQFKTGKLDMMKLANYKFDDNLFLTSQIKHKGKNHGMVFYLDMSSSMQNTFKDAITQLLEVVSFCRNSGIPVSVYGFSDSTTATCIIRKKLGTYNYSLTEYNQPSIEQFVYQQEEGRLAKYDDSFALLELFSPKMKNKEFVEMFDLFVSSRYKSVALFGLNGTPLSVAMNTIEAVVNKFRKETNAEIVNVAFLTDGGDTHSGTFSAIIPRYYWLDSSSIKKTGVLVDPKTKRKVIGADLLDKYSKSWCSNPVYLVPAAILKLMKYRLRNVNVVNFYITSNEFRPAWNPATNKYDTSGGKYYKTERTATMEFDEMYFVNPLAFKKSLTSSRKLGYFDTVEGLQNAYIDNNKAKKEKQTMVDSFISKIC